MSSFSTDAHYGHAIPPEEPENWWAALPRALTLAESAARILGIRV